MWRVLNRKKKIGKIGGGGSGGVNFFFVGA